VTAGKNGGSEPKILVFSSTTVSDLGIDMAGASHMHYSTAVQVIPQLSRERRRCCGSET